MAAKHIARDLPQQSALDRRAAQLPLRNCTAALHRIFAQLPERSAKLDNAWQLEARPQLSCSVTDGRKLLHEHPPGRALAAASLQATACCARPPHFAMLRRTPFSKLCAMVLARAPTQGWLAAGRSVQRAGSHRRTDFPGAHAKVGGLRLFTVGTQGAGCHTCYTAFRN